MVLVDFEVFGKVQGVHFRKYTQEQGKNLGLKGWCMNTDRGTVIGRMEGSSDKILKMKNWLKHKGSPKSRIDKTEFTNEQVITKHTYSDFIIKK
ncbi:UNVERIFIED_CONTAM: hypothetical protein PYX00_001936 [Menopon gallinae]|uniref:Acylphosphatase n=1 Tax=Menopon gallinae TaxID=328185 RepID=A0AAW2IER8_9NEOP